MGAMEVIALKVTNSEIIKSGEQELIDTIIADLDWGMIEKIVKERHRLQIRDDIDYRQGDIIVHDSQVAYKLDFDVKMTLSVIFDRDGNYLSLGTSDDLPGNADDVILEPAEAEALSSNDEVELAGGEAMVEEPPSDEAFSSDDAPAADPEKGPSDNFSKMASHIADMISEINDN